MCLWRCVVLYCVDAVSLRVCGEVRNLGGYNDRSDICSLQADHEQEEGEVVTPLGEVVSRQPRKFYPPLESIVTRYH